jgi:hypothetical protein
VRPLLADRTGDVGLLAGGDHDRHIDGAAVVRLPLDAYSGHVAAVAA